MRKAHLKVSMLSVRSSTHTTTWQTESRNAIKCKSVNSALFSTNVTSLENFFSLTPAMQSMIAPEKRGCVSRNMTRDWVTNMSTPTVQWPPTERMSFASDRNIPGLKFLHNYRTNILLFLLIYLPASSERMYDLPAHCDPIIPTTKKSVWSIK